MTERVHPVARLPHHGPSILLTLIAAVSLVGGCSSKIGSQGSGSGSGSGPQAVVTAIGHKATQANGAATLTVRSGADVLLSGKDTVFGSAALTSFAWTQSPTDTPQVDLLYRTANTVSFTAPTVAQPTPLNLVLTVVDAHNNSSTAKVTVNVQPASDPDQFLTAPVTNPTPRSFQVAVVPQSSSLPLNADAPVCISVVRTINYTERGTGGVPTPATPVQLPALRLDTSWLQASGWLGITEAGGLAKAVASYKNPRASFDVPVLNDEDLFVRFNQPQGANRPPAIEPSTAAAARIAQQLVPADVDTASLSLTITAGPGTCASPGSGGAAGATLVVSLLGADGTPAKSSDPAASPSLTVSADDLYTGLQSSTYFAETADTAANYYKAIDPIGSAPHAQQTLNTWLDANCFNHSATNYGADTHAVYTNNFDLGFGRDMYFVTCTQSNLSAGRQVGDSASVVINYPSLEATIQKQNPILAVVMSHNSYSASGTSADRFTKFFAFAPDDRDGNFYLARSANFDHRGQRYLPGACTVCHGGTVNAATLAGGSGSVAGDLNAAFMPWDEGALLFSDNDPAYTGTTIPKAGYTEADQKASIYAFNQHAYATYLPADPKKADRYAAPKALIEKWYGGLSGSPPTPGTLYSDIKFKNPSYSDADFPTALALDASGQPVSGTSWSDENAANADDLYHTVFAHECRSCHTQLYQSAADPKAADRFMSYKSFADRLTAGSISGIDIPTLVFHQNRMPLARLTTDRFWVSYSGGDSPATVLAKHAEKVGAAAAGSLYDSVKQQAIAPGAPQVVTSLNGNLTASSGTFTATRHTSVHPAQVRVDAQQSFFVRQYGWSLCLQSSQLQGYSGPLCPTPMGLVGATADSPGFDTSVPGTYLLSLNATDTSGTAVSSAYQASVVVNKRSPSFSGCILTPHTPITNIPYPITLGCASPGDGLNILTVAADAGGSAGPFMQNLSASDYQACTTSSNNPQPLNASACVANSNQVSDLQSGAAYFQFAGTALSPRAIHVRLIDEDGVPSPDYSFTVGLDSTVTATAANYALYRSTAAVLSIYTSLTNADFAVTHGEAASDSPIPADSTPGSGNPSPLTNSYTILPANSAFDLKIITPPPTGTQGGTLTASGPKVSSGVITGATIPGTDTLAYVPKSAYTTCDASQNQKLIPPSNLMTSVQNSPSTVGTLAFPTTPCTAADGDTFTYSITLGAQTTSPKNLNIRTDATTSFANLTNSVYADLSACSSCHATGAGATSWTYATATNSTYGSIAACFRTGGSTTHCVVPGSPETSHLYTNACHASGDPSATDYDSATHLGVVASAAACARMYQWIVEGASYD